MALTRIMLIRHAEKPPEGEDGVTAEGDLDVESLTPRGWQRAGALTRFFSGRPGEDKSLIPSAVFAAGVGTGSKSKRPIETVTPLVDLLSEARPTPFITKHAKTDHQALVDDILSRDGILLVAWEHKELPTVISRLPDPPPTPHAWPDDRFDIVWILDMRPDGWRFSQLPQLLLAGDRSDPIP